MAKKTKPRDGRTSTKLTPIRGGKKKKPGLDLDLEKVLLRLPDIEIPAKLLSTKITPRSLSSLSYQRKLLTVFAPYLLPSLFNGLNRKLNFSDVDIGAQRLTADIFGLTPKSNNGVNVLVNQQNAQVSRASGANESEGIGSFEDITRILQERRRSLPQSTSREILAPIFEATPED